MSGPKFVVGRYYKNRGDCCDFVLVEQVLFDSGHHAEIKVTWYTQMSKGWRKLCTDQFVVSKSRYVNWAQYEPRGGLK